MRELELQLWGPRPLRELELQPLPEPRWDRVLQGRRLVPPRKQTRLLAVVRRALVQAVAPQVLALAPPTWTIDSGPISSMPSRMASATSVSA